jgi:radical SAM protein with 4Fe4S-binding SPASM domain
MSNTICALPWTHLNFEPQGKVTPCCLTAHHRYFAGDLNDNTIEEIWNSQNMKTLRKQMIRGEEPEICSKCFDSERVTNTSARLNYNDMFEDVLNEIPEITDDTGFCNKMELQYWDFRFSNLCNMKCRSCGPISSSAWVQDAKKLGWLSEQDKVSYIETVDNTPNIDFLKDQSKHVKKIYFAGGEPLLMKEHWAIMDYLVENKRFDVNLSYNTNMSVLEYKGKNVFDYWDKWDQYKIEIWPSIDDIGERAEIIRSGTVWDRVDKNITILSEYKNILVKPNITVGVWNVHRIPEIIQYFVDKNIIKKMNWINYDNFNINIIDSPPHYSLDVLPFGYKQEVKEKLVEWIEHFNIKYNTSIDHHIKQVIWHLDQTELNTKALARFKKVTADLDKLRNEKLLDVIPELRFLNELDMETN